jgi:hypothetical protein
MAAVTSAEENSVLLHDPDSSDVGKIHIVVSTKLSANLQ